MPGSPACHYADARGDLAPRPGLRRVSRPQLLALAGDDPWVRWALPDPLTGEAVVAAGVAVVQRPGRRPGAWVLPLRPHLPSDVRPEGVALEHEGDAVVAALRSVVGADLMRVWGARSVSVPQEHATAARSVLKLALEGGDWEWMWTQDLPAAVPGEERLVDLDDMADAEELQAFSAAHNPREWTVIGEGQVVRWVGARDTSGALLAVGGAELTDAGTPHLAGIVTAGPARGRGWGGAATAALTRWAVDRHRVSTLGMFSDNVPARRVYARLGYRTARAWHSRRLVGG